MRVRAVLLAASIAGPALLSPVTAAGQVPTPTAATSADPTCATTLPSDARVVPLEVVDGAIAAPRGWTLQVVAEPESPSWGVVSPDGDVRLTLLAWSASTVDWETVLRVVPTGPATVTLGDGVPRNGQLVQASSPGEGTARSGVLVTWAFEETSVAVIALSPQACMASSEAVLRALLAGVQPPTRRLQPAPTPVVIVVGEAPSPSPAR